MESRKVAIMSLMEIANFNKYHIFHKVALDARTTRSLWLAPPGVSAVVLVAMAAMVGTGQGSLALPSEVNHLIFNKDAYPDLGRKYNFDAN